LRTDRRTGHEETARLGLPLRTSTLDRDLNYTPLAGELERPAQWTADWVKHRLIEAFVIERRMPDKRVGPALVRSHWVSIATVDSFADRMAQGEIARENVLDAWARVGGVLPFEISRMEEALQAVVPSALFARAQPQGKYLGRDSREDIQELCAQIHGCRAGQAQ
jgi:hypothetical protein